MSTTGWSNVNPNFGEGFCEVVPGTLTNTAATLRTYIYEVYNVLGQFVGWHPTSASNVTFAYSALGLPDPSNAIISGPEFICTSGTFKVNDVPQGAAISWSSSNPNALSINSNGFATRQNNFNGQVNVTATIDIGCGPVNVAPLNVLVGMPSITFAPSYDYICNQTTVTLNTSSHPLIWETTNGLLINGNSSPHATQYSNPVTISAPSSGSGQVTIKAACDGSILDVIDFEPCLPWNANLQLLTSSNPAPGEPMDAVVDPNPWGGRYLWYINGNLVTTTHEPEVRIYDWECGESYLEVQAEGYAGVTDPNAARVDYWGLCTGGYYAVYPNPSGSTLTVRLSDGLFTNESTTLDRPYQLKLMNQSLETVYSGESSEKELKIPLDKLPNGNYYLNVYYKGAILPKQIVIKK